MLTSGHRERDNNQGTSDSFFVFSANVQTTSNIITCIPKELYNTALVKKKIPSAKSSQIRVFHHKTTASFYPLLQRVPTFFSHPFDKIILLPQLTP